MAGKSRKQMDSAAQIIGDASGFGVVSARIILDRVISLARAGESEHDIAQRLNPPALVTVFKELRQEDVRYRNRYVCTKCKLVITEHPKRVCTKCR